MPPSATAASVSCQHQSFISWRENLLRQRIRIVSLPRPIVSLALAKPSLYPSRSYRGSALASPPSLVSSSPSLRPPCLPLAAAEATHSHRLPPSSHCLPRSILPVSLSRSRKPSPSLASKSSSQLPLEASSLSFQLPVEASRGLLFQASGGSFRPPLPSPARSSLPVDNLSLLPVFLLLQLRSREPLPLAPPSLSTTSPSSWCFSFFGSARENLPVENVSLSCCFPFSCSARSSLPVPRWLPLSSKLPVQAS